MDKFDALESMLDKAVEDFQANVRFNIETSSIKDDAVKSELEELGRQTFYALDSFKAGIINFLAEN